MASQTSEWSRVSEAAKQQQPPPPQSAIGGGNVRKKRQKREKRFNKKSSSRPQSRSHSRNSQKDWNDSNYPRSEVSDKGEDEDDDNESLPIAKAEPVWMCDYCTYANAANFAVCQMCAKTNGGKDRKSKRAKRPSSAASAKSGRREDRTAAAKGSRRLKSPAGSEENDDTEQDVRRAYYAVRRSAGGKMLERGERNPILIQLQSLSISHSLFSKALSRDECAIINNR